MNNEKIIWITWGLGIGDWGLGIGDWGLANPQSPIPNPPIPNPQLFKNINLIFRSDYYLSIRNNLHDKSFHSQGSL